MKEVDDWSNDLSIPKLKMEKCILEYETLGKEMCSLMALAGNS